ncbi:MAG: DNA/RNA nuclease SfsA [Rhodobacteraceae bacterium]|nr:DNA/RNA nuclease SfsA [Paracoccaceae bacterium]
MRFETPLIPARLERRYKRFLADCILESDGRAITAHCANPGSMLGLAAPGTRVWLEPNDDPKRKLAYGWRLVDHENGHFTGVDTGLPNRLLKQALARRAVPELAECDRVRPEVRYATASRIDFLLESDARPDIYVEVKSVTLCRQPGLAEFPDSVTARGARHLDDLAAMVAQGHRAVMLYLVQRTDCQGFALARDLDPAYAAAFDRATGAGVEVLVYDAILTPEAAQLGRRVEIDL